MLNYDTAQLLAPMMDTGSRYEGKVLTIISEFATKRLFVDISPAAEA